MTEDQEACSSQQFQRASSRCSEISSEKQCETHGASQEMTMMQLSSGSMSLSGSSGKDTLSVHQSLEASEAEEPLTYWEALQSQTSSVWDLLSGDPLEGIDPSQVLCKSKREKLNPRPYISFGGLGKQASCSSRSGAQPEEGGIKPSLEIGLKFDF